MAGMTIQDTLDTLRGRMLRARGPHARGRRAWADLAPEIGVSRPTLIGFLQGKSVTTATLELIEHWVDRVEAQRADEARRQTEEHPYA